ncbi:hypothetical protein QVD17_31468 [Tagetes erecta]|uniref:Uncharacterized protein n=1 Tax=Tagetes erecta TaxID=13708 RepID=A0AAD8NPC4_TARER|nr:hypothetical protein QVD17_31468 [Tagetes erecta]
MPTTPPPHKTDDHRPSKAGQRKPGGWKSMPYVLGMESFERLASIGLIANFTVFLMRVFHMNQVSSSYLINIWSGIGNFTPLIGAYISDTYVGKFWVIAFSSFASLFGMVTLTLVVAIPALHPASCTPEQDHLNQCQGPTTLHMGVLILALGFLSIGSGGIRPCSLPFGVDQFDSTTNEGRKDINSFFNWYYTTFTIILLIALTLVVYIQDSVSWIWGFAIPTILMVCSIVLFFVGTKLYVYVKPEGSIFSGIIQVFFLAYKKRKLQLPKPDKSAGDVEVKFFDSKGACHLPLTDQFRFLNKGGIILEGEVDSNGSRINPWKLASIQQIEQVKTLINLIPILASGIICYLAIIQQGTFTISQALKMDRHLGPHFQIPPGSLAVFSMITIGIWLPFYDRILVPSLRPITKHETGITLLQRIGIGNVFSILSMVVAGIVEKMRRGSAVHHNHPDGVAPLSVIWLAPQLILMGFAEAFTIIGQIEFCYKEFPENMKSFANSMLFVIFGLANYVSGASVMVVHKVTGTSDHPDWLTANINVGRVDYYYYVIAILGVVNMIYFVVVADRYQYKTKMQVMEDDVELNNL